MKLKKISSGLTSLTENSDKILNIFNNVIINKTLIGDRLCYVIFKMVVDSIPIAGIGQAF